MIGMGIGKALVVASMLAQQAPATTVPPSHVPPSRVTRVIVEGNHVLGTRELQRAIDIKVPVVADPSLPGLAADRVLALYRQGGFLRAKATAYYRPPSAPEQELVLEIAEGKATRLDSLAIEGCRGLSADKVRSELALREGRPLAEDAIAADAERILRTYEEEGYPFAVVSPGQFRVTSDGSAMSFAFQVVEGSRVRVKDVAVSGNDRTRAATVEREMRLERGDVYRQSRIDQGRERLLRSGLFLDVSTIELRPGPTGREVTLMMDVVEAPTNSAEGAVGYVPRRGASADPYLTGQLHLSLGNIAGTGRKSEVHWRRLAPGSADWQLSYLEPWVAGIPLSAGIELRQEVRDSTYTTRGVDLSLILPLSFSLDAELSLFRERTSTGARGFGFVEESRRTGLSGGFAIDLRDRVANPRRGGFARIHAGWAERSVEQEVTGSDSTFAYDVNETQAGIEIGWYRPLSPSWVLAFEGDYAETRASEGEIPFYELHFIGGSEGPRGYEEDQFAGSRAGRLATEYRYHLSPRSRFHVFADLGYHAWRGDGSTHWGYGAGLNLESRLGLVGLDLGLPVGGGPSEGKLHLRLRQEW